MTGQIFVAHAADVMVLERRRSTLCPEAHVVLDQIYCYEVSCMPVVPSLLSSVQGHHKARRRIRKKSSLFLFWNFSRITHVDCTAATPIEYWISRGGEVRMRM